MSYQVIARKYRPQQFDDVIGQSVITTTLKNAIEQRRIGHAYLFSGVRGVGKTTSARILAKALNCVKGPTATPCEECDSCREIKNGNAVDVIEIDAASNRGIDDIRQLRENVKYRPSRDRYKIYIIDEAHQLTDDAWDALLKTLEEPPDHVVFIFATTERHKLKPTILSRCQNFSFRTLSYHEIYKSLEVICKAERIQITPGALSMLVRAAEGSIRDSQSLLDQVISFCGTSIDEAKIRELLGFVPQEYVDRLSEALISRDTTSILNLVNDLALASFDMKHFCREAIQHVRNLMIVRVAGRDSALLELPPDAVEKLEETATHFSEEDLVRYFHLLSRTDADLKWSTTPRLHLELGLVRLVQAARLMSIEDYLTDLKASGRTATSPSSAAPRPLFPTSTSRPSDRPSLKKTLEMNPPGADSRAPTASNPGTLTSNRYTPTATLASAPAQLVEAPLRNENEEVRAIRSAVEAKSKFLSSLLDHVARLEVRDGTLWVCFDGSSQPFYSMLNSKDQIATLSQICQNVLGKSFQVKIILMEGAGSTESRPQPAANPPAKTRGPLPEVADEIVNDPLVKSFLTTFRAEITDIKKK